MYLKLIQTMYFLYLFQGVIIWKWDEFIRVFIGYKKYIDIIYRICFRKLMNVNRGKLHE